MIDTLIWAISFVMGCLFLGGGAVLSVRMIEQGKAQTNADAERTKRIGMDNVLQIEQQKLDMERARWEATHGLGDGS